MSKKFKQSNTYIAIIIKNAPVAADYLLSMIKQYNESLCQGYSIITTKIPSIEPKFAHQMFFKLINNFECLNRLVLTLLVFLAYSKMTE